ncbi:phage portal protein [Leuconostoc carnosum]|uniref:phage tail assembly chaperone n=1 Tax=Leuconostoc TaxID=1243 RepID=UPI001238D5E9|nr:phage portal protein [Leuconostoc carnosum]KAA8371102.1 phage portal protein [Leuconostoc carnosum]KAA8382743.1 phage portal protein [Leuconostoc carnosum]
MTETAYNVTDFLKENVEATVEEKSVKIDRFPTPFVIKTITEEENAALRKRATLKLRGKNGQVQTETDGDKYAGLLVVASTIVPNFADAALQENYGTATAADTARKMLRAGEFAKLAQEVTEFNGFNDDVNDLAEEAKN